MTEVLDAIRYWFDLYYGDGIFFIFAVISYLYLWIDCKDARRKFLYPIAFIIFCIMNPVLYLFAFSKVVYWRLFWMIPDAIIISYAITSLVRKCKKKLGKICILCASCILIISSGKNVFVYGGFEKVQNWQKLPNSVIDISDTILDIDKGAKVIFPSSLYCDIRQYAPEISMLYGRNAEGFVFWDDWLVVHVYECLNVADPDYNYILGIAVNMLCNFIVVEENKPISEDVLVIHGYKECTREYGYIIYYNEAI